MKFLRGLILTVCLIIGESHADATNKKHEVVQRATFILYGSSPQRGRANRPLCTAFVYKKAADGYFLITAGHCFIVETDYSVAEGQIVDKPALQSVEMLNHVDDGKMDVAELHLKTTKQYPVLEFEQKPAEIDDKVFYVGYPEMASQVVGTGRVESNLLETEGPDKMDPCDICKGRFLAQVNGGPGASGSPLISEKSGKVLGIVEGHIFENGVVIVPAPAIESYYNKVGHSQAEIKNVQSEGSIQ